MSIDSRYVQAVGAALAAQPLGSASPLTESDIAHLPRLVQRYVRRSGTIGLPRPQNVRLAFDALMWRAPSQPPITSTSIQYNFFDQPARLFLMKARMYGLPIRAMHVYRDARATFTVRVASLFNMVDLRGDEISRAETVTVLNDMCVFAPGSLVDTRLAWKPVDESSVAVRFANGPHIVGATLRFNADDELVDFSSDDRPESSTGTFRSMRWSTPISDYQDISGRWLPTRGSTIYARPEGPFTYGRFTLRSIAYDVSTAVVT